MALVGDTGNGATFTLTTQTAAASLKVDQIQIGEITLDMLEVSTLSTSDFKEMIASDLKNTPELTVSYVYSASATAVTCTGSVDTATVTFPVGASQTTTTGATFTGTGIVTSFKLPDLQNGNVMKGQIKFKFDGDTGPTYTRGS
jgi:hypothetical protein